MPEWSRKNIEVVAADSIKRAKAPRSAQHRGKIHRQETL
jgi:hypothetical protein